MRTNSYVRFNGKDNKRCRQKFLQAQYKRNSLVKELKAKWVDVFKEQQQITPFSKKYMIDKKTKKENYLKEII